MTEYEAFDLLTNVFSNMWAMNQFGFGLITAYCLLAYYIGSKLTFFQVTFVNVCFLVMNAVTTLAVFNGVRRVRYLLDSLPDSAIESMPVALVPTSGFVSFGLLLLIGCYAFMWSIRHPKTE